MTTTADIFIGCRVAIRKGTENGTVRFIGTTQFALGEWVGVELDEPTGKHDGTIGDVQYFECEHGRGCFVRRDTVELEFDDEEATAALPPAASPPPKPSRERAAPRSDGLLLQRSERRAAEDEDGLDAAASGGSDEGEEEEELDAEEEAEEEDAAAEAQVLSRRDTEPHIARHAAAAAAPIIAELEAHFDSVYTEHAEQARGGYEFTEATDDFATEDYASEERSYGDEERANAQAFIATYSGEQPQTAAPQQVRTLPKAKQPPPVPAAAPAAARASRRRDQQKAAAAHAEALERQAAAMERKFEKERVATMAAARAAVEHAKNGGAVEAARMAEEVSAREGAAARAARAEAEALRVRLAETEEELEATSERLAASAAECDELRSELVTEQRAQVDAARQAAQELQALASEDASGHRRLVEEHKLAAAATQTAHEREVEDLNETREREAEDVRESHEAATRAFDAETEELRAANDAVQAELDAAVEERDEHALASSQRAEQLMEALAAGAEHEDEAKALRVLLEQHAQTTMDLIRENEATSAHNEELIDNLRRSNAEEHSHLQHQQQVTKKMLAETRVILSKLRVVHRDLNEQRASMSIDLGEFSSDSGSLSIEVRTALEAQGLEICSCMDRAATARRVSQLELLVERLRASQRELVAQLRGARGSVRTLCWVPTCQRGGSGSGGNGSGGVANLASAKLVLPYEQDRKVLHIDAIGSKSLFSFDSVHGPSGRSTDLLEGIDALIHSVLQGEDACLFALLPGAPGNPSQNASFTYSTVASQGKMETLPLDARMASADEIELLATERLFALMEPVVGADAGRMGRGGKRFVGGCTTTVSHVSVSEPLSSIEATNVAIAVAAARGDVSVGQKEDTADGDDAAAAASDKGDVSWWGREIFSAGIVRDLLKPSAPLVSGYEVVDPTSGSGVPPVHAAAPSTTGEAPLLSIADDAHSRAKALAKAHIGAAMAVSATSAAEVAMLTSAGKQHLRALHMRAADVPLQPEFRSDTATATAYRAQAMAAEAQQHRVLTLRVARSDARGGSAHVGSLHVVVLAPPQAHGGGISGANASGMGASLETLRGVLAVARMGSEDEAGNMGGSVSPNSRSGLGGTANLRKQAAAKQALQAAFRTAMDGCALTKILRRALGGVARGSSEGGDGGASGDDGSVATQSTNALVYVAASAASSQRGFDVQAALNFGSIFGPDAPTVSALEGGRARSASVGGASAVSGVSTRVAARARRDRAAMASAGKVADVMMSTDGAKQAPWRGSSSFSRAEASREAETRRTRQRGATDGLAGVVAPLPPPAVERLPYDRENGPISPEAWATVDDLQRIAAVDELAARRRPRRDEWRDAERYYEAGGGGDRRRQREQPRRGGRGSGGRSGNGMSQTMRRPRKVQAPAHHGVRSRAGRPSRGRRGEQRGVPSARRRVMARHQQQFSQSLRPRRGNNRRGDPRQQQRGGGRNGSNGNVTRRGGERWSNAGVRQATDQLGAEIYAGQNESDYDDDVNVGQRRRYDDEDDQVVGQDEEWGGERGREREHERDGGGGGGDEPLGEERRRSRAELLSRYELAP